VIPWHPIADLPDALKDGRDVLLWDDKRQCGPHHFGFYAGVISPGSDYWLISGSSRRLEPSHFAEINPPGVAN